MYTEKHISFESELYSAWLLLHSRQKRIYSRHNPFSFAIKTFQNCNINKIRKWTKLFCNEMADILISNRGNIDIVYKIKLGNEQFGALRIGRTYY